MKFLFAPLASHGYVYPAIGLALGLRQRGHEVAFVTGQAFKPVLEQVGLERIPRGDTDGLSFLVQTWAHQVEAALQFKHIHYALKRFPADVLVGTPLSLGPYLIRERLGIPLAILGLATYLWPSVDSPPAEMTETDKWQWWRHGDMMRHLNRGRELLPAPPLEPAPRTTPLLGDLFLLRSVPEVSGPEEAFPDQVHMVGDCLWEPPGADAELEAWLQQGAGSNTPLLYVQHGRAFGGPTFWPQLVELLADRSARVAASTSRMEDKPTSLPAHFHVREYLPQGQVMRHAAGLISSATTTAVLGAFTHGLPSIVVPDGSEQPDLAALVARSGAGLSVPANEVTKEVLKKAIDTMLDSATLRGRAQELQRAFARVAPERALELLELLGRTGRMVTRQSLPAGGRLSSVG